MTGYCHYCGSLVDEKDMVRVYDLDRYLKWIGCFPCYKKHMEIRNYDKK